jgi:hypothetical protein
MKARLTSHPTTLRAARNPRAGGSAAIVTPLADPDAGIRATHELAIQAAGAVGILSSVAAHLAMTDDRRATIAADLARGADDLFRELAGCLS